MPAVSEPADSRFWAPVICPVWARFRAGSESGLRLLQGRFSFGSTCTYDYSGPAPNALKLVRLLYQQRS